MANGPPLGPVTVTCPLSAEIVFRFASTLAAVVPVGPVVTVKGLAALTLLNDNVVTPSETKVRVCAVDVTAAGTTVLAASVTLTPASEPVNATLYGPPFGPLTATLPLSAAIVLRFAWIVAAVKLLAATACAADPVVPVPIVVSETVAALPVSAPWNVISNCSTTPTPPGPAATATFPFRAGIAFSVASTVA